MTAIAVGSVRSGGATTPASSRGPRRSSSRGSRPRRRRARPRYGLGREPGLVTLAASRNHRRRIRTTPRASGWGAGGGGPGSPERATQLLRSAGKRIAGRCPAPMPSISWSTWGASPVGARPGTCAASPLALVVLLHAPRNSSPPPGAWPHWARAPALVLVGSGPYAAGDVTTQFGSAPSAPLPTTRGAPVRWRRAARPAPLLGPPSSARSARWLAPCSRLESHRRVDSRRGSRRQRERGHDATSTARRGGSPRVRQPAGTVVSVVRVHAEVGEALTERQPADEDAGRPRLSPEDERALSAS